MMHSTLLWLAAALPLAVQGVDLMDYSLPVEKSGIVRFPVKARQRADDDMAKRQIDVGTKARQTGSEYTMDISIGTPAQTVTVILDTGSSALWVNPVCRGAAWPKYCESFPQFKPDESSTYVDTGTFSVMYYGSGYAWFEVSKDTLSIGCR